MGIKVQRLASGKIHRLYESTTHETVQVFAPVNFYDDFLGDQLNDRWTLIDTSSAGDTTPVLRAEQAGASGEAQILLDTNSEVEDSGLTFGDSRPFDIGNNLVWEAKLAVTSASMTGIRFVAGMSTDFTDAKDDSAAHVWFSMDGDLVLDVECDDGGSGNDDDNATGTTWTTGDYHILRIDCSNLADVRFYIDGADANNGATLDMSSASAANQQMQPIFALDKATGATLCVVDIDYVRVFSTR